jgi:microsomal dipeptidase-like Zn-dependent dipeptidase
MWNRDLNDSASRGHMDLPRLQEGNVALQLFSSVTKTPKNQNYDGNGADTDNVTLLTIAQLQPVKTWSSLTERSLYHAQKRDAAVAGSKGAIKAVDTAGQMEAKGMIIDIAHLSHKGVAEILAMATRPVVSSHGGVQATCNVNRNLTDDEVRGVAKTGGIIGIGYWDGALCDTSPRAAAKAMKHVRDLVGIQHVALGSDYDGATTVRFDTSQLVQVTQALMDEGFTAQEIRAVMGENALRVIRAGLVPRASAQ